jgi:hypothetical protein
VHFLCTNKPFLADLASFAKFLIATLLQVEANFRYAVAVGFTERLRGDPLRRGIE